MSEHISNSHALHNDTDEESTSFQDSKAHAPHADSADDSTSVQNGDVDKDTCTSEESNGDDDLPHLQSSSTVTTTPPLEVTMSDFQLKGPSLLRQLERTLQSAETHADAFQESWDWTTMKFAPARRPYSADMANLLVRTFKHRLVKHLDNKQQERAQGS